MKMKVELDNGTKIERTFSKCLQEGAATRIGGSVYQCNLKGECLNGMFFKGFWLCKTPLKEQIRKDEALEQ